MPELTADELFDAMLAGMKHEAEFRLRELVAIQANTAYIFEHLDEVYAEYAAALGKKAGDLTYAEKQQAVMDWTLEHANA